MPLHTPTLLVAFAADPRARERRVGVGRAQAAEPARRALVGRRQRHPRRRADASGERRRDRDRRADRRRARACNGRSSCSAASAASTRAAGRGSPNGPTGSSSSSRWSRPSAPGSRRSSSRAMRRSTPTASLGLTLYVAAAVGAPRGLRDQLDLARAAPRPGRRRDRPARLAGGRDRLPRPGDRAPPTPPSARC